MHLLTSLAALLCLAAVVAMALGYQGWPAAFGLAGFFLTLPEVPKYTSRFQFFTITLSALLLGLAIDIPNQNLPITALATFFAACVAIARIAFFRTFSYTAYPWFEPLFAFLSLAVYVLSAVLFNHDWKAWLFPAPLVVFSAIFAWGTVKDKNQLLKQSRGGYKVKIGEAAVDFELPDQDGNPVKLSDFRGRHLLLIFVRGDWCPGCHMMLRTYEKNNHRFREKNVMVMAIGPDPVGVNRGMVEKLGLDFKVLSDEGQRTAMTYGVQLKEYDNQFAEKYEEGIPLPASFLVDKDGLVRYVSRPDKVGEFLNPSLIFPIVEKLN